MDCHAKKLLGRSLMVESWTEYCKSWCKCGVYRQVVPRCYGSREEWVLVHSLSCYCSLQFVRMTVAGAATVSYLVLSISTRWLIVLYIITSHAFSLLSCSDSHWRSCRRAVTLVSLLYLFVQKRTARLCVASVLLMSLAKYGSHTQLSYSRIGCTSAL